MKYNHVRIALLELYWVLEDRFKGGRWEGGDWRGCSILIIHKCASRHNDKPDSSPQAYPGFASASRFASGTPSKNTVFYEELRLARKLFSR